MEEVAIKKRQVCLKALAHHDLCFRSYGHSFDTQLQTQAGVSDHSHMTCARRLRLPSKPRWPFNQKDLYGNPNRLRPAILPTYQAQNHLKLQGNRWT